MKKIITKIICFVVMLPLAISALGCGGDPIIVPEYTSNDYIDIVAYSTPTNPNWNGTAGNADGLTVPVYQDMADAGFTGAQPLMDAAGGTGFYENAALSERDARKVLKICEQLTYSNPKHKMMYMVRDWTFMGFSRNVENENIREQYLEYLFRDEVRDILTHPNYAGHNLWDEPDIGQMYDNIATITKFKELLKDVNPKADPFFNLLPDYANSEQLGGTYQEYIDYYCENLAPMLGYICYDYYPLFGSQYSTSVKNSYLSNFEVVAKECKERDLEFRMYIQTAEAFPGSSRDIVGAQDYRFQIYTAMAYGCEYFIHYTYNGWSDTKHGIVDINNNKTFRYYAAQTVHNEVHAIEDVFLNFKWDGVMVKEQPNSLYGTNPAFEMLNYCLDGHDRIKDWSVTNDTVLGAFHDAEGRDGFMIVNYSDPAKGQNDDVTITFNDARALLMYRYGQKIVVPIENGQYTFKLEPGEGRFVIPLV